MEQPTKLMNRNYFLLWQGHFISRIGSQIFMIAMIVFGIGIVALIVSIIWTKQSGEDNEYCWRNTVLLATFLIYYLGVLYVNFFSKIRNALL